MNIRYETTVFLMYIFIGIIISFIFDIFRAVRKFNGKSKKSIYIYDILFFLLSGLIIIIANVFYTREMIRLHLIISMLLGVIIYITAFGNSVMLFISKSILNILKFGGFLISPIVLYTMLVKKLCIFLKKITEKCCKMLGNMIIYVYSSLRLKFDIKKLFKNKGETNEVR